jgi:uncharacterized NAD-dependent epimerase/dehydratase family protein
VVGEYRRSEKTVTLGLRQMSFVEAAAAGAKTLILGVANAGGVLGKEAVADAVAALEAGLNVAAGLHERLADQPEIAAAAARTGRQLFDVRVPRDDIKVGNGRPRAGLRLLTVGTDCSLGKMYTSLTLVNAMKKRGMLVDFRATGQTGIMIAGSGMPMDAVVADFAAGAAETLSPDADADHWDVIEGQGSLLHPSYAGVSLALLHGSQPDVIIVCGDPFRKILLGNGPFEVPDAEEVMTLNLLLGARTNPATRCGGFAYNTSAMTEQQAEAFLDAETRRLGLPAADPIRGGARFERLLDSCVGR